MTDLDAQIDRLHGRGAAATLAAAYADGSVFSDSSREQACPTCGAGRGLEHALSDCTGPMLDFEKRLANEHMAGETGWPCRSCGSDRPGCGLAECAPLTAPVYVPGPDFAECVRPGCPAFHHQYGDRLYYQWETAPAGVHIPEVDPRPAPAICTKGSTPEDRDWYDHAEPGAVGVRLDRPCPDCGHIILVHPGAWNPALHACVLCELVAAR